MHFSRICITIDKIYPSHILSSSYTTALAIVQYSNAKGVFCGNCPRTNYIGCCFFLVPYVGLSKTHTLMYLQHQTTCKQCVLFDIISFLLTLYIVIFIRFQLIYNANYIIICITIFCNNVIKYLHTTKTHIEM